MADRQDTHAGERRREDEQLRAIVEGVEAATGDQFFASVVRSLAEALGVQYAFVSELSPDRTRFRTVALWGRGRPMDNLDVPIGGTPCEAVLSGEMSHHPDRLQQRFPTDTALVDWGVVSYCGVPILDAGGTVVGHFAILDDRPMRDGPRGIAIMRIFAARARSELERMRVEAARRASEERLARVLASAMDAIVTFNEARDIELFNTAAEKVFRCPAAQAIGAPIDRFLTEGLRAALADALEGFAGGQARPWVGAPEGLKARDTDGREFPVEASVSHAETGGCHLYTLILRDVEERQRAEERVRQLHRQNVYLQEELRSVHNFEELVGQSPAFGEALRRVALVATADSTVLVTGETGTGKELIARALHSGSHRKDRPLIKVSCATLPTGLIESELFGHERGAFTGALEKRIGRFELADGGTIFLDEVGEIPPEVQVKLLRVLQEQEFERIGGSATVKVDVRVIAATNRDLAAATEEGTFRRDLYYRLNVFPIALPALRERRGDIPLLVHYFVSRYAAKIGRRITRVPESAMRRLVEYSWPGNVRELENVIERAVILSAEPDLEIAAEALPAAPVPARRPAAPRGDPGTLEQVERSHIVAVLRQTNWRVDGPKGAARILKLHPSTLRSRMQKLGIRRDAHDPS